MLVFTMSKDQKLPKSILITGASSGIGEALALHYAGPGVFLALSGRNEDRLEQVAQACRKRGALVDMAILSVTETGLMEDWITQIDEEHPLDLVVANAGISGGTGGPMVGEPISQARAIFDVNLMGVLNTLDPIIPRMTERGQGQIAVISSMAGFRGFPGAPAYSASKGAVRFYGEALRGALKPAGIKVNVICPGFVATRMTKVNDFPMPFTWSAPKAANRIARDLSRNVGRITFPWPVRASVWLLALLPDCLAQRLLTILPAKASNVANQ
jgi:short-subunit dehydrogenase